MRKIVLSILGIALIIASIFYARHAIASKNKVKPTPQKIVKSVYVDTIQNTTVPIVISANGNLVAKRRLELFSEVQGIFLSGHKLFRAGQNYQRGETLIRMDASEYYAGVQAAKSNLYNDIAAIMPDLRLDFPDVYDKWYTYLNAFDISKTTPKLPEITSEKENYFISGRGIIAAYYNVKNQEQRLSKYSISAPFSGILTEALVTEGTLIRNGQKLGEFIDPSVYELEVAVSKSFLEFLQEGEPVALNNLEQTQTFVGNVTRINGSVDQTTQTISVFIEVQDPNLKEGMYLEANLNAREEQEAIEVPRNLVLENNEIYVVRDSILETLPVRPVFFSEVNAVLKEVPNGTVILSKPVPGAHRGMLVKPIVDATPVNQ